MELDKKVITALALVLTVGYGITMAEAGVSIPGCAESTP